VFYLDVRRCGGKRVLGSNSPAVGMNLVCVELEVGIECRVLVWSVDWDLVFGDWRFWVLFMSLYGHELELVSCDWLCE
jgi:hypothetical protein